MEVQQAEQLVTVVEQEVEISAAPGDVYRGLIDRLTHLNSGPDNIPMPMTLEEWPGGRWFRDLGNGSGHLWGFVQSIKAPTLLELYGPMFMSFAVATNMIIRVEPIANGARIALRHQILGPIPEEYRTGVNEGWAHMLNSVKERVEK